LTIYMTIFASARDEVACRRSSRRRHMVLPAILSLVVVGLMLLGFWAVAN